MTTQITQSEVITRLRDHMNGIPTYTYAARIGVSPSYLFSVLAGRKPPSKRLLDLLGLEKVKTTLYRAKS